MDFRKRDNVSVDCVIFGLNEAGLNVLLRKRKLNMFDDDYPVVDDWIITGGRVFISKTLEASANIIFKGITGWSYLPRLTKYVFPFVTFMFDEKKGETDVMEEMVKILSGDNAKEVISLIQEIVDDVQVDGSNIDFNQEFAQNYDALILLVVEVIKLNYFDSFSRLVTNLPKE